MAKTKTATKTATEPARRTRARKTSSSAPARPGEHDGAARTKAETPYHHGDLARSAAAARPSGCWSVTACAGLTLRAVAREAGVSHAAPTHHFGDLDRPCQRTRRRRLPAVQRDHGPSSSDAATTPLERALARPKAYVAYAQAHPGIVRHHVPHRAARLCPGRSLHEAAKPPLRGSPTPSAPMRQEQIRPR